jgi:sterol-4alpha-carboxylate 3-dehydrogenase (decarboxylating)
MTNQEKVYVVTGGNGFLGSFVIDQLAKQNADCMNKVAIFDVCPDITVPHPMGSHIETIYYHTDISNLERLSQNLNSFLSQHNNETKELIVFHTASLVSLWVEYEVIHRINVLGTQYLVKVLCELLDKGVLDKVKIIYTSTNQVEYGAGKEGDNLTETFIERDDGKREYQYSQSAGNYYISTKRQAERYILESNGKCGGKLLTTSIRPAGIIWGPHSTVHKQMIISYKKSHVKVKGTTDMFNTSFVENVAYAHVFCEKHMSRPDMKPCGRAYFVGDFRGNYYDFFRELYESVGLRNPRDVDYRILYMVAFICSFFCMVINLFLPKSMAFRPLIVTSELELLVRPFHTSHENARKDFGYEPLVNERDAMEKTKKAFVEWNQKREADPNSIKDKRIL